MARDNRTVLLLALLMVCFSASHASAHPVDTSAVYLDISDSEITAEVQLHITQLEIAVQRPLARSEGVLAVAESSALSDYFASHVRMVNGEGKRLPMRVLAVKLLRIEGADHISAHLSWQRPSDVPLDQLVLGYDAVLDRIPSHEVFVLLGRDDERGIRGQEPRPVGTLRAGNTTLVIDRSDFDDGRSFRALFLLGARHIGEGLDHLLFLLLLLLPAPFIARGLRWSERDTLRGTLVKILTVVTAFTVGHSVTLAAGVLGAVHLPSRIVEVTIAVSILLSAIHAAVPVFPRREAFLAAGFGLIHGLAFSTVLAELGLHGMDLAFGLLAFNLGIEVMQLVVVAVAAPWFILIGRSNAASPVRVAAAMASAVVAMVWIAERAWA